MQGEGWFSRPLRSGVRSALWIKLLGAWLKAGSARLPTCHVDIVVQCRQREAPLVVVREVWERHPPLWQEKRGVRVAGLTTGASPPRSRGAEMSPHRWGGPRGGTQLGAEVGEDTWWGEARGGPGCCVRISLGSWRPLVPCAALRARHPDWTPDCTQGVPRSGPGSRGQVSPRPCSRSH